MFFLNEITISHFVDTTSLSFSNLCEYSEILIFRSYGHNEMKLLRESEIFNIFIPSNPEISLITRGSIDK